VKFRYIVLQISYKGSDRAECKSKIGGTWLLC